MSIWIRTDEQEEAVAALEAFVRFVPRVHTDLFEWRWAILSLRTALQGFMVVAIRDTAGLFPLPDELATAWLQAYRNGGPLPEEKLDSFPNLYRKIKRKDVAVLLQARRFVPKGTQGASVKQLNRLRNQFSHFLPASWSLEANGLPRICLDCLAIIRYLAHDYRELLWRDASLLSRADAALKSAETELPRLRAHYEASV